MQHKPEDSQPVDLEEPRLCMLQGCKCFSCLPCCPATVGIQQAPEFPQTDAGIPKSTGNSAVSSLGQGKGLQCYSRVEIINQKRSAPHPTVNMAVLLTIILVPELHEHVISISSSESVFLLLLKVRRNLEGQGSLYLSLAFK